MNPTSFSYELQSVVNGENVSKFFDGIENDDVTIAMGTAFAASYFALTSGTPKKVILSGSESADLNA